ncbi:MAG TPA: 30S ribosomal protein S8e [Nitrososphaerales archaeon]|nr:30S ribosomal protein S8e [Nitrososphaerales archaeon]
MTKSIENLRKRKSTGGRRKANRGRRAFERDSYAMEPTVGPVAVRTSRLRGGHLVIGLTAADVANVAGPSGKVTKSKIVRVKSSPANRDYERRGVITRGAVIETEAGEARVTSKPTDDGVVNAVLTGQK